MDEKSMIVFAEMAVFIQTSVNRGEVSESDSIRNIATGEVRTVREILDDADAILAPVIADVRRKLGAGRSVQ